MNIEPEYFKQLIKRLQEAAGCPNCLSNSELDCQDLTLHGGRCASFKQRPLTLAEEEFLWEGEESDHE